MAVNAEQNQKEKQEQQNVTTGGGPSVTPGATQSRTAAFSTGQQPGQQSGSGRFTNLQKYIGANEGAGSRMAQGIGSNLERKNQASSKEAETSASAVRDGIQSAQNKVQTGNQYLNQVKDTNFNANDIAGDENKLNEFTDFRTGKAVDANALANQNVAAQTNYQNYQNQLNNQMNQTQTDQGRYGLLKNAFGGGTVYQNPYSTGQQRLDQLFLQSGGQNGINNIQNQLRGNINQVGGQLNDLTQAGQTINTIGSQAKDLATGLQDITTGLENKFVGDIEATQDAVNAQRLAEQNWANEQYRNLQGNSNIQQRFADLLNLNGGQNLYNSLTDKSATDVMNFGSTTLASADQLANANQRSYYDSLAKLAGITGNQYRINAGNGPEAAVSNKGTIGGILNDGKTTFDTNTANKDFSYTWGGGAIVPATSGINADTAKGALNNLSATGADKLNSLGEYGINKLARNGVVSQDALIKSGFTPEDASLLFNYMQNNMTSSSSSASGRDTNAARLQALAQASNLLGNEGYYKRVNIGE